MNVVCDFACLIIAAVLYVLDSFDRECKFVAAAAKYVLSHI